MIWSPGYELPVYCGGKGEAKDAPVGAPLRQADVLGIQHSHAPHHLNHRIYRHQSVLWHQTWLGSAPGPPHPKSDISLSLISRLFSGLEIIYRSCPFSSRSVILPDTAPGSQDGAWLQHCPLGNMATDLILIIFRFLSTIKNKFPTHGWYEVCGHTARPRTLTKQGDLLSIAVKTLNTNFH